MRRYLWWSAWVNIAVTGLLLAAGGAALILLLRGGTTGTAEVASCEQDPVTDDRTTTPSWSCEATFVGRGGTPRRDHVWITVNRTDSPAPGERIDVVVGAEWWRPEHGIEPDSLAVEVVVGFFFLAAGGAIVFAVVRLGLRRLPSPRLAHAIRFLVRLPLFLALPVLAGAVAAVVARAVTDDWQEPVLVTYASSVLALATLPMLFDLDPSE